MLKRNDFGDDFKWGVTISGFQNEGAPLTDGKTHSIWDVFANKPGIIKNGDKVGHAANFYHGFADDIKLAANLNFKAFQVCTGMDTHLTQWHRAHQPKGH
jgi:beta-glucosidase